jgi:hypothetical protein
METFFSQGDMVVVNSWGIGTDHFGGYAGKKGNVSYVRNVSYVSYVFCIFLLNIRKGNTSLGVRASLRKNSQNIFGRPIHKSIIFS